MSFQDPPSAGTFIRTTRTLCGLSLTELAADTGFSVGYLSLLERGHRRLTPAVAERVRRAFAARIGTTR